MTNVIKIGPIPRAPLGDNKLTVYVDGASDNRVTRTAGWAVMLVYPDHRRESIDGGMRQATNQIAELTAALQGLKLARLRQQAEQQIEIISDSKYVVSGITEYIVSWVNVTDWKTTNGEDVVYRDVWEELQKLDGPDVTWTHIRGHSGVFFNEWVDRAANAARRRMIING